MFSFENQNSGLSAINKWYFESFPSNSVILDIIGEDRSIWSLFFLKLPETLKQIQRNKYVCAHASLQRLAALCTNQKRISKNIFISPKITQKMACITGKLVQDALQIGLIRIEQQQFPPAISSMHIHFLDSPTRPSM